MIDQLEAQNKYFADLIAKRGHNPKTLFKTLRIL